jgi:hypothetical protein
MHPVDASEHGKIGLINMNKQYRAGRHQNAGQDVDKENLPEE